MASNAKIGMLLGLVIIFVFAFIIRGLSDFDSAKDDNDLPPIVNTNPPGIKPEIPPEDFPPSPIPDRHHEVTSPPENNEQFRDQLPAPTSPDENDKYKEPLKRAWPKVHIVRKGENLADIAKEYYGSKEGNRRANIKRIFEANSNLLDSPDKIYPGQELIIPPLWASAPNMNSIESIFPDSMFEKVETIGRRHL